ncbi:aspartate aminotransferase family protein, partial [Streptomyces sp. SP18ES09]|nr:aspartate aminotransferase family protein [Streptomyces sp. SP18ES09]
MNLTTSNYTAKNLASFNQNLENIGYQLPRVVAAIQEEAGKLATLDPAFAVDVLSESARLIAERNPGDLAQIFFTNGGA